MGSCQETGPSIALLGELLPLAFAVATHQNVAHVCSVNKWQVLTVVVT